MPDELRPLQHSTGCAIIERDASIPATYENNLGLTAVRRFKSYDVIV